jgi:plasmid maintenance system antidote protein VapI
MTTRVLADLVGVSPSHLRNIETGHRPCTVELAAVIAAVLGTDPERYDPPPEGGDGT